MICMHPLSFTSSLLFLLLPASLSSSSWACCAVPCWVKKYLMWNMTAKLPAAWNVPSGGPDKWGKKKNRIGIPLIQLHLKSSICPPSGEHHLQLHTALELLIYKASPNFVSFWWKHPTQLQCLEWDVCLCLIWNALSNERMFSGFRNIVYLVVETT